MMPGMRTLLLTAILAASSCAPPASPPPIFQLTPLHVSTVGRIEAVSGGQGTAFPVAHTEDGFLALTCQHVVDGKHRFTLRMPGRKPFSGGAIHWADEAADVALVRFVTPRRPRMLTLARIASRPFSRGWCAGFPMGVKKLHVTPVLFQIAPERIDGLTAPGSSGGPVMNDRGEVVGLLMDVHRPRLDICCGHDGRANFSWVCRMASLGTVLEQL